MSSDDLTHIDRSRLHAEADYEDLLRRIRQLESRAS